MTKHTHTHSLIRQISQPRRIRWGRLGRMVTFWAWHWVAECSTGLSLRLLNGKGKPRRVEGDTRVEDHVITRH